MSMIVTPGLALERDAIHFMTRRPDNGEVRIELAKGNRVASLFLNDEDAKSAWEQYTNPPFQAEAPTYTQSWPNRPYGQLSPTWPAPTVWPPMSSRSCGNAMQSPATGLMPTAPATLTGCSSFSGLQPSGSGSIGTIGGTTSSEA